MTNVTSDRVTLEIDGRDVSGEWESLDFSTPCLVYEVPDEGPAMSRLLGPKGFHITLSNPSEALWELVDGGVAVHAVKIAASGCSLTHPTQFHRRWIERSGVRKMFGVLASNRDNEAKWVDESQPVNA